MVSGVAAGHRVGVVAAQGHEGEGVEWFGELFAGDLV